MAASLNKVMLIGNLGADPVIRQTQDGKRLAQLSLATSESWKDKSTGEKKEKTSWHRICLLYTSPSPRDQRGSRMPASA